jgi:hypothetical protein
MSPARTLGLLSLLAHAACLMRPGAGAEVVVSSDGARTTVSIGDATFDQQVLIPARVRRLSVAEAERTLSQLTGLKSPLLTAFPPDARREGFSPHDEQAMSALHLAALEGVADSLTAQLTANESASRCAGAGGVRFDCPARREEFNRDFARLASRAYRRPLSSMELDRFWTLYQEQRASVSDRDAFHRLWQVLLQLPSLWYVSELGERMEHSALRTLTEHELASAMAFSLTGGPPDETLLARAAQGELSDPSVRAEEALRLMRLRSSLSRFRQFVREWLGVEVIHELTKAEPWGSAFAAARGAMLADLDALVDHAMTRGGGSVAALLTGRAGYLDPALAHIYEVSYDGNPGPRDDVGRVGVLTRAAFLSAHASAEDSHPVHRGVAVARRLLCVELPDPSSVGIDVAAPAPDPSLTTRQRFEQRTQAPGCQTCHAHIDPLGYALEGFDPAGRRREREEGQPIDTAVQLSWKEQVVALRDADGLSAWLAGQPETRVCALRQAFRFFFGHESPGVELGFVALADRLPDSRRDNLAEAMVAYVASPLFELRRE